MQCSEETKKKISKANKGKHRTLKQRKRISKALRGRHLSEEHKRKIGLNSKGKKLSKQHISRIIEYDTDRVMSEKTKRKISKALMGHPGPNKGKHPSKDTKRKMSLACRKNWEDPEYRKKQTKAIIKGYSHHHPSPNKPERKLMRLLNKLFPGEYKFVGNGSILIQGKNPDFINVNGQKKIIELFGDYWHSEEVTGQSITEHHRQRIRCFGRYGYETLIIWECELEDIKQLKKELIKFHKQ